MTFLNESVIFSVTYDHVLFDIWEVSLKKNNKKLLKHISEKNIKLSLFGILKSETLSSDWR